MSFLVAFGLGFADGFADFPLSATGFGRNGAETAGTLGGGASAASSIHPLAPLFKSWIWAKPPSRPIKRNGRPAGKPYVVDAEEDGLASIAIGCLETRIISEPGDSGCSACSTASSVCSACLTTSPVCSACSFGADAGSCAGDGVLGTDSVVSTAGVVATAAGGTLQP